MSRTHRTTTSPVEMLCWIVRANFLVQLCRKTYRVLSKSTCVAGEQQGYLKPRTARRFTELAILGLHAPVRRFVGLLYREGRQDTSRFRT